MAISFQNATNNSGISYVGKSWGAAWADFNEDGYPDLWVTNHQDTGNLYLNQGDGTFTEITNSVFPIPESGDTHTAAWADFDGDNDLDLVQVVDGGSISVQLYVNEAGILTNEADDLLVNNPGSFLGRGVLWFDYDRDGLLDIVVNAAPLKNLGTSSTIFRQTESGFEFVGIDTVFDAPSVLTTGFGIISDLTGDDNFELILRDLDTPFIVYDTTSIPFQDVTNTLLPTLPSGNKDNNIDSDLIAADFNGDLLVDLFSTQKLRNRSDLGQVDSNSGKAQFFINNEEEGIEFKSNGDLTFNFLGQGGVRSGAFRPVSLDNIYIGSNGINPTDNEFTLSPDDPDVQGILDRTPGTDSGIYLGYDSAAQQWQLFFSSPNRARQSVVFQSTEEITELAAIGFDPEESNLPPRLFINTEQGFSDRSEEAGFNNPISGVNAVAGDFDNDMDVDIYVVETGSAANRENILYDNQGDGTFVTIPNAGGAAGSSLGLGDSVTTVDYNRDGFLDLFLTNGAWPPIGLTEVNPGGESLDGDTFDDGPYQLFQNEGNNNNWLQIDLQGVTSNPEGIGAKIFATAGEVTQLREQNGGFHNKAQNSQRIHFGLAENSQVDLLEIRWPSGVIQQLEDISANQVLQIVEETDVSSNNSPQAVDDSVITQQNQAVNIDVLNNDTDADGDSLSLSIDTAPSNGSAVVNDNGTPNNLLDDLIVYTPNTNFTGNDQFTYMVDDGNGGFETATVSIVVNGTTEGINGTEGRDTINANAEDDLINGLGGRDVLRGAGGNDTLNGGEGNDNLLGGFNADILNGDSGNDFLIGGFGNDILTGGSGRDRFRFADPNDGVDEITDFNGSEDTIEIKGNNFDDGLTNGVLPSSQFVAGTTAGDSDDRFIYDQSEGALFFDVDGNSGNNPVLLVTLSNQADLSASDIVVF